MLFTDGRRGGMSDVILIIISVIIFILMAKFTDQSARAVCCLIRGVALILISNCALEMMGLGGISLNLFTVPVAGALGLPAIGFLTLFSIFF